MYTEIKRCMLSLNVRMTFAIKVKADLQIVEHNDSHKRTKENRKILLIDSAADVFYRFIINDIILYRIS